MRRHRRTARRDPASAPSDGRIPGVELQLADDGEVLVRGAARHAGLPQRPGKTAEAIDADGWLHTGDVGELDDDGYLRIVDRKKELIINAAARTCRLRTSRRASRPSSPLIGQAMVIGDARPYNVALVVLDPDGAMAFSSARASTCRSRSSSSTRASGPRSRARWRRRTSSSRASSRSSATRCCPTSGCPVATSCTPTMKLKRKPIAEKYAAEIDALYA